MHSLRIAILCLFVLGGVRASHAQFSPGELSTFHRQLEGMDNCLQCHETGNEIGGRKCLECHQEIKTAIERKSGYHFKNSSQQCVTCHKEHLGRNAQTIRFDKNTFDHAQTGFLRTGKHGTIVCEDCHSKKNIKNEQVLKIINATGRQTYLGLSTECVRCHADRHQETVGTSCQNCHGTTAWSPAPTFDHGKTKFKLVGKHVEVGCNKCHAELVIKDKAKPLLFTTKGFADCAPCHLSPHTVQFANQSCGSCHSPDGWKSLRGGEKFNHDVTAFKLVGKHASVGCEKCHKSGAKSAPGKSFKLAHNACTDCHADFHQGEFAAKYNNKCEKCHTTFGFLPSTFTLAAHGASRFSLSGAHAATPCERCHTQGRRSFRFASLRCESCHQDKHGGQFVKEMAQQSCGACHSTADWFPKNFDHSKTKFALEGKHVQAKCEGCHKPKSVKGVQVAQYKGTSSTCETCHTETHAGQFAAKGKTNCTGCHQSQGWNFLLFDHNTQSTFLLTGAHKRVECRRCHLEERRGASTVVRFKPLSTRCESCHAQGSVRNG